MANLSFAHAWIRISATNLVRLIVLNFFVIVLLLILTAVIHAIYHDPLSANSVLRDPAVSYVLALFNLSSENTFAAWYSSMLLLHTGLLALVCYLTESGLEAGPGAGLRKGWLLMACLFTALSLDELGSLHENAGKLAALDVMGDRSWQSVVAIPLAGVVLYLILFAWFHLRVHVTSLVLLVGGALLFLTVPLQEHFEMRMWSESGYSDNWKRPIVLVLLEEGAELLASLCFFMSMVFFLNDRDRASETVTVTLKRESLIKILVFVFAGINILALALYFFRFELDSDEGIALNWFPAGMAFVLALCMRTMPSVNTGPLHVLLFVLLSVYFGINFYSLMRWSEIDIIRYPVGIVIALGSLYFLYSSWKAATHAARKTFDLIAILAFLLSLLITHVSVTLISLIGLEFLVLSHIMNLNWSVPAGAGVQN